MCTHGTKVHIYIHKQRCKTAYMETWTRSNDSTGLLCWPFLWTHLGKTALFTVVHIALGRPPRKRRWGTSLVNLLSLEDSHGWPSDALLAACWAILHEIPRTSIIISQLSPLVWRAGVKVKVHQTTSTWRWLPDCIPSAPAGLAHSSKPRWSTLILGTPSASRLTSEPKQSCVYIWLYQPQFLFSYVKVLFLW